jgi:hypothetical protein
MFDCCRLAQNMRSLEVSESDILLTACIGSPRGVKL